MVMVVVGVVTAHLQSVALSHQTTATTATTATETAAAGATAAATATRAAMAAATATRAAVAVATVATVELEMVAVAEVDAAFAFSMCPAFLAESRPRELTSCSRLGGCRSGNLATACHGSRMLRAMLARVAA